MHSFEVSLEYESVDRTTFSTWSAIENVLRSTLSYPNETSKECIQFLSELSTFQFYQTVDLKWMLTSKSPIFVLKRRTCITHEPGERQLSESKPSFD